jgi:hypothetical protein
MSDPYTRKLVNKSFYHSKIDVRGKVIVVLDGRLENRNLRLINPISRTFPKGTIIELIGTDDPDAAPGSTVDAISYLGFVEISNGGVLLTGDEVMWKNEILGMIAGYDDTHMPNHQNTILRMHIRKSGRELGMQPGDEILIKGFDNNS